MLLILTVILFSDWFGIVLCSSIPGNKINFYLKYFKNFYSGRKLLIAKEVTKIHETFHREDVDKIKMFKSHIKGELTIVISENKN